MNMVKGVIVVKIMICALFHLSVATMSDAETFDHKVAEKPFEFRKSHRRAKL